MQKIRRISMILTILSLNVNFIIGDKLYVPVSLLATTSSMDETLTPSEKYNHARNIRVQEGHTAASKLYQDLINEYGDVTAATRIAASQSSPHRHDKSCPLPKEKRTKDEDEDDIMQDIFKMRSMLEESDFENKCIQKIFGIKPLDVPDDESNEALELTKAESLAFAKGPVYIKPVPARPQSQLPVFLEDLKSHNKADASLKCLVALFLLGFAVPLDILSNHLIGGSKSVRLMERLGFAFPCESDPSMVVPYVHIFPIQIQVLHGVQKSKMKSYKPLMLVTDCHPTILSRSTVGMNEDGAVMYIGPDSLALVQHTPLRHHLTLMSQKRTSGSQRQATKHNFKVLDLCTGSGVQALSVLASLERVDPKASALCVDINERALRFTKFNSLLNGFEDRVHVIKADLMSGQIPDDSILSKTSEKPQNLLDFLLTSSPNNYPQIPRGPFDIILSNPPFVPTPSRVEDNNSDVISKRYGLFSSGGSSGEDVLQFVVSISSRVLRKDNGMLAIVSEFMNPPLTSNPSEGDLIKNNEILQKISNWWEGKFTLDEQEHVPTSRGKGLLFTNSIPISASTYAARRADDAIEYPSWIRNLDYQGIHSVSPGLLYINTCESNARHDSQLKSLDVTFRLVPKDDELGSIWTPVNFKAVSYIAKEWETR